MVGGAIFEDDAKVMGPMLATAIECYFYCSLLCVFDSVIHLGNVHSDISVRRRLDVIPLFFAGLFLVVSFFVFLIYLVVSEGWNELMEPSDLNRIMEIPIQELVVGAPAMGMSTVVTSASVLACLSVVLRIVRKPDTATRNLRDYTSFAILLVTYFSIVSTYSTLSDVGDPLLAVKSLFSMVALLIFTGIAYIGVTKTIGMDWRALDISRLWKRASLSGGALLTIFWFFRDFSNFTITFGVVALLLLLLFVFYLNGLESQILSRTEELREERAKSDALLENMLPGYVIDDLKQRGVSSPKTFPRISVMFTDFVGFTKIAQGMTPEALIEDLNKLFSGYDEIVEVHDSERIKTIGDAYMCASGLSASSSDSTTNLITVAHEMLKFTSEFNKANGRDWQLRIGIAHGDCVGGVVGEKKYLFDLFGDVVNTAARMESHSEPGRINVDEPTFLKATSKGSIEGEKRPVEFVKGKGELQMYFLN